MLSEAVLLQARTARGARLLGGHTAGGARRIPAPGAGEDAPRRGGRAAGATADDAAPGGDESGAEGKAEGRRRRHGASWGRGESEEEVKYGLYLNWEINCKNLNLNKLLYGCLRVNPITAKEGCAREMWQRCVCTQ